MMAAREGREKIAAMLIESGAKRETKNDLGDDAVAWATRNKHAAIARMVAPIPDSPVAVTAPKEPRVEAVVALPTPAAAAALPSTDRVTTPASGNARMLSEDEYRRVLARLAAMKPALSAARLPKRMVITAERRNPSRERVEFQYGE